MLLAYDNGEIIQSCLPHPKNSEINNMFKILEIKFSYLSLSEIFLSSE